MKDVGKIFRKKSKKKHIVAIGIILVFFVVAGLFYFEDEKKYALNMTWDSSLIKTNRWRMYLEVNITNLSDEKITILWQWSNLTKIRFLSNDMFIWYGITGNSSKTQLLNPRESILSTWNITAYGFIEEPTDMWIDLKIKTKEFNEIFEFSFHLYIEKVHSEIFPLNL